MIYTVIVVDSLPFSFRYYLHFMRPATYLTISHHTLSYIENWLSYR